jgi:hypothetical protein
MEESSITEGALNYKYWTWQYEHLVAKAKEGRAILVHVMKAYGKQAVHFHSFLTSAFTVDGGSA